MAGTVRRYETGVSEEEYIIMAEDFGKMEPVESDQKELIQALSWEDESPRMVCDLRTGQCTEIGGDDR